VLAAAIRHRCDALVTGDRTHFGRLYGKVIHGVAIHSPRSIAEALLGDARPAEALMFAGRNRGSASRRRAVPVPPPKA
jgi:hypothetical protein